MANSAFTIEADGQGYITFNGIDVEFEIDNFNAEDAGEYASLDDIEFELGHDAYQTVVDAIRRTFAIAA